MYSTEQFDFWLHLTTNLSDSSIYKYVHAASSISKEMSSNQIIHKDLFEMNLLELDVAINNILCYENFKRKNSKGNNMYSNSLKQLRYFVLSNDNVEESTQSIVDEINKDTKISITEKESLIKSRLGQGVFRKLLLEKYDGKCIVTGIDINKLLIASHIKPWSISNNHDRISSENGLLLSANIDKLFDCGLITFADNGNILISHFVGKANENRLGISKDTVANLITSHEQLQNLEYHRDVIFIK